MIYTLMVVKPSGFELKPIYKIFYCKLYSAVTDLSLQISYATRKGFATK